ncbi:hypothetical protein EVAR_11427_1 [Eumeta japonica]|uniref:Uncharacterized protein n=1 Tax=Eumeta variegata TaxID=151549 RepID=A0A4C1TND2_EUMVA|nr:hypothetical protein EVAR_11427_1 [Eumeta japonica]
MDRCCGEPCRDREPHIDKLLTPANSRRRTPPSDARTPAPPTDKPRPSGRDPRPPHRPPRASTCRGRAAGRRRMRSLLRS